MMFRFPEAPAWLRRLTRRPLLPLLLAIQTACALAVISNALSIIAKQLDFALSPTGLQENNLWVLETRPADGSRLPSEAAMAELQRLQKISGVDNAALLNDLPLRNYGWRTSIWPTATRAKNEELHVGIFFASPNGFDTLGLHLAAGRKFIDSEFQRTSSLGTLPPRTMISAALAERLFGSAQAAIGQKVYTKVVGAVTVIGVIPTLQSSWPDWPNREFTLFMPAIPDRINPLYVLRMQSGHAPPLYDVSTALPDSAVLSLRSYAELRRQAYGREWYLITLFAIFTVGLIVVVATASFALAGHWVNQRFQEIGVRLALGATPEQIFRMIHIEVLTVLLSGAALGVGAAHTGSSILQHSFAGIGDLSPVALMTTFVIVVGIGQAAVWSSARQAAAISPAATARNV